MNLDTVVHGFRTVSLELLQHNLGLQAVLHILRAYKVSSGCVSLFALPN